MSEAINIFCQLILLLPREGILSSRILSGKKHLEVPIVHQTLSLGLKRKKKVNQKTKPTTTTKAKTKPQANKTN